MAFGLEQTLKHHEHETHCGIGCLNEAKGLVFSEMPSAPRTCMKSLLIRLSNLFSNAGPRCGTSEVTLRKNTVAISFFKRKKERKIILFSLDKPYSGPTIG